MRTVQTYLWTAIVSLCTAGILSAQGSSANPEGVRGKVLLLDNDRILEGDIERVNGQYRIRRSIGELWIPAERTKRLCRDLDDCYETMKRQINLKDADERLRLARWCQQNGLKDHALHEAKIALDMRPEHAESLSLVQMLQRFAISSSPALAKQPAPITRTSAARAPLDVSADAFASFATRVQPILMNTCVSCHSHGKGGDFQLIRVTEGGHRTSTQANLNAVLDFVVVEKPVLSPLLIKSVVAHGGANHSPLKGRNSQPYLTLQTWIDQLIEGNPHLREIRQAEGFMPSVSARKDFSSEARQPPTPSALPLSPPPVAVSPPAVPPPAVPPPAGPSVDAGSPGNVPLPTAPPAAAARPTDPFDPAEFNSRPK